MRVTTFMRAYAGAGRKPFSSVAQICNLLYRRIAFCVSPVLAITFTLFCLPAIPVGHNATAATNLPSYYAHPAVLDTNGVIAPWYQGLNGQLDERLNIAVNVYKRYPWVDKPKAVMAAPDFVYNSHWSIKPDGTILIPPSPDGMCGDLGAPPWAIIKGLTAYYQ